MQRYGKCMVTMGTSDKTNLAFFDYSATKLLALYDLNSGTICRLTSDVRIGHTIQAVDEDVSFFLCGRGTSAQHESHLLTYLTWLVT